MPGGSEDADAARAVLGTPPSSGHPQRHRPAPCDAVSGARSGPSATGAPPPAADDAALPAQDRAGSDEQPHRRQALRRHRPLQAAPATPGPATSNANEREAARAQPQPAD